MTDPLSHAPPTPTLSLVSKTRVPNTLPTIDVPYRLAIVGEAPGETEEAHGQPFIGASGNFLDSILGSSNILRSGCFVGNVCKYRPPGNDITEWGYSHSLVLEGWEELKLELQSFRPHAILALGNTPLHFLTGLTGITSWRGSILSSTFGKVIPSIHPAAVLREYKQWPLLRFDCARARTEAETRELALPVRTLELNLSADEICNRLDNWPAGRLFSFDIEGGLDAFPCCSVAGESNRGFIIAWSRHNEVEQSRIAVALSRALYSEAVPKVLQNSLYDRFVLAYGYRMLIRNVVEDTMLKHWEIYPESSASEKTESGKKKAGIGKGLGVITSIWTREPYYKFEGKQGISGEVSTVEASERFYKYCIKDSCVTLESCLAMDNALTPKAKRHYDFGVELLNPLLYMELRGFNYDSVTAQLELGQVKVAMSECGTRLELNVTPQQFTKKEFSNRIRGEGNCIGDARLKLVLNQKGYPPQYKGKGTEKKQTCDVEALLNLSRKHPHDPFLSDILLHRKLESIKETLEISTDPDGRVRCGYNLVGTETGRLTCYTSPTGSGANLQTITKKLRKLYTADEGHWLFQCDLSGADGWTVAARCLEQGDPTMWDDYHYGLKPAKIICLMKVYGAEVNNYSRPDLKALCDKESQPGGLCDQDSWQYFGCKRVQHMSNYAGQPRTGVKQIMIDSYKITGQAFYMTEAEFGVIQHLYFLRYSGLYQWHNSCKRKVADGQNLTSASGHERKFFGRRKSWNTKTRSMEADHETWKEFLADEPQENTTYANNLALANQVFDPKNWKIEIDPTLSRVQIGDELLSYFVKTNKSPFYIEPFHSVHDAGIGQFPKERTAWAVPKIHSYFQNELEIANVKVIIPFEGAYGPSWGQLGEKYGGGNI